MAATEAREEETAVAGPRETGCSEEERFRLEMEFVQCLANPDYLHFLARSGLLTDPSMVAYLEYLQYWQLPEYARLLMFPWCLYSLRLLTIKEFRTALHDAGFKDALRDQQHRSWLHFLNNRFSEGARPATEGDAAPAAQPGGQEGT